MKDKAISVFNEKTTKVGIEGDKIYIKGLSSQVPDGVYVGTIDSKAGTATFASGQYQGISAENYRAAYIIAANQEYDYLTDWFTYVYAPETVFKYDADAMTLELEGSILFTSTPDRLEDNNYFDYIDNPYIKYQAPDTKVTAIDPAIIMNYETGQFTMIGFIMPVVTEAGVILDPSKLYYQVMVNDQPMTFTPEAYNDIEKETTEIPYGYNTGLNGNFFTEGSQHMLVVYAEGYTSLGIRIVYKNGEDDTIYSSTAYVPGFESGIGTVGADRTVKSETFYDLQGREVTNPSAGLYIRRTTYNDGSTQSSKVIR